jgi:glycosyltransferase involved in cell wall biosynthesis
MISIIVPVYNAAKYIDRCVESIINQSYKNWELILIDDGSIDSSFLICKKYSELYANIHTFSQTNAGPSVARNNGLRYANGDYVAFIDSDDWIESDFLEQYSQALCEDDYDLLFQSFVNDDDNGNLSFNPSISSDTYSEQKSDIITKLYECHNFGWVWNKLFKISILRDNSLFFDDNVWRCEDELFTIEFLNYASSIKSINSHKYHYVSRDSSLIRSENRPLIYREIRERIIHGLMPMVDEKLAKVLLKEYLYDLKFCMLMACMNRKMYECHINQKKSLLLQYYNEEKIYSFISGINVFSNKIKYSIVEIILWVRIPKIVLWMLSKF